MPRLLCQRLSLKCYAGSVIAAGTVGAGASHMGSPAQGSQSGFGGRPPAAASHHPQPACCRPGAALATAWQACWPSDRVALVACGCHALLFSSLTNPPQLQMLPDGAVACIYGGVPHVGKRSSLQTFQQPCCKLHLGDMHGVQFAGVLQILRVSSPIQSQRLAF